MRGGEKWINCEKLKNTNHSGICEGLTRRVFTCVSLASTAEVRTQFSK